MGCVSGCICIDRVGVLPGVPLVRWPGTSPRACSAIPGRAPGATAPPSGI